MKKAIRQAKKGSSKKNLKASNIKKAGYNEKPYNAEQQDSYNISKEAKSKTKNTAAPDA